MALGLGKESNDKGGDRWTQTAEELEQQIRLIRFVAPESPGVAFFGKWKLRENKCPLTDKQLDEICSRFLEIPTDGHGLEPKLFQLGKVFTKNYDGPTIFCSSAFVLPYFHSGHDGGQWGESYEPPVARALMMNLGNKAAEGMQVSLRDPEKGIWAAGLVASPVSDSSCIAYIARKGILGLGRDLYYGSRCSGMCGVQILSLPAS